MTEAGLAALAGYRQQNRHALDSHDAGRAHRAAALLVDEGRVVFRGVTLRARSRPAGKPVRPDVFSIRNTSHGACLAPFVHRIKVSPRRPDDRPARNAGKRAGYRRPCRSSSGTYRPGHRAGPEIPGLWPDRRQPTGLQLLRLSGA